MHGSKAASVEEALTHIRNGQTIMLSGFTNVGSPNKFIVKMAEAGITDIDLISLAKQEEEVFTPYRSDSVRIDHRDYVLKMLQRIRDEAHRFAITYFRSLHSKRNLASVLAEIEGVGKKKQIALMEKFGTIDKIMHAGIEDLTQAEGIGEELAKRIKTYFEEKL